MAQPFLRHPDRHASQCQIGRVQVTELVKREARHARTLAQPRELALGQVVAVQRIPVGLAEDQVLVMIVGSKKTLLFDLHPLDLAQCLEHLWTELHSASPRLRLRRLPQLAATKPGKCLPNRGGLLDPVDIVPEQTQTLAHTQSSPERKEKERIARRIVPPNRAQKQRELLYIPGPRHSHPG